MREIENRILEMARECSYYGLSAEDAQQILTVVEASPQLGEQDGKKIVRKLIRLFSSILDNNARDIFQDYLAQETAAQQDSKPLLKPQGVTHFATIT